MVTYKAITPFSYAPYLQALSVQANCSCFFDIETTGFRPSTSHVYLIGMAWKEPGDPEDTWTLCQWMSEAPQREAELLRAFAAALSSFSTVVHFNGDRFDIPYLKEKYDQYALPDPFQAVRSLDLYAAFRPLKKPLGLTHLNQRTLEQTIGLYREDPYDGGKLIPVYRAYVKGQTELARPLLLHNREDLTGMMQLIRLQGYLTFFSCVSSDPSHPSDPSDVSDVMDPADSSDASDPRDPSGSCAAAGNQIMFRDARFLHASPGRWLQLSFTLPLPLPGTYRKELPEAAVHIHADAGTLTVPIYSGTLQYYFPDWKMYYYLPQEDRAVHKSVAIYVDPAYRRKATPETCYVTRSGDHLPYPLSEKEGLRRTYDDKVGWFPLPEDLLTDRAFLARYLCHVLSRIIP